MSGRIVGPHDPIELNAPLLGFWIECECGWISGSFSLPNKPRLQHAIHVKRSESDLEVSA